MRAIPRLDTPLANLAARVTNAGGFFAFAVAYVLFALIFLLMLADTILHNRGYLVSWVIRDASARWR